MNSVSALSLATWPLSAFWVLVFTLFFSFPLSHSQNFTCHPDDILALRGFQTGIDLGWSNSNCCDWVGVTCSSALSLGLPRVTKLELPGRSLSGNLSSSIGFLAELRTLNLSNNSLFGHLPRSLFTLQTLEALDLSENDFTGPIPPSISLPEIRVLDVTDSGLVGEFPSNLCSNGSKLRVLKMADNRFAGPLPGRIGDCALLQDLSLGYNILSGELPAELFGLQTLTSLTLQDNRFTGDINPGIGNLSGLVTLDVSQNMFRGNLPDVFANLSMLKFLILHSNHFSGSIPFSVSNSPSIMVLNLRNNSFAGEIKLNCSAMTSLTSLRLGHNQFHGLIPGDLAYCPNLTILNMAGNNFIGGIPESFKELRSLSCLSMTNASLQNISGALEVLQNCKNLTILIFTLNFFGEELPSDSNIRFEKLRVLLLGNCRLSGSAPSWLKGSHKLQFLDMSGNRLSGVFPDWFGYFESLFFLEVSNNFFSGEIPKSLTGLKSMITGNISLVEIALDFPFLISRGGIMHRNLQYNHFSNFPPTLSLSRNNFTGPIWPQFGNLKELHFFDLKHNKLSGSIPSELSGMASLESMDLSYNHLTGTIPSSFGKLSFLSKFSVAYNQLHGTIPSTGQFLTFPNSAFEGNPGLCGQVHSLISCPSRHQQPRSTMSSNTHIDSDIGISIGVGFGTGLVIALGCTTFLYVRDKRAVRRR